MKVAGHNYFSILCAQSNNKSITNLPAISPPVDSRLDVSTLLSYSVYDDHAVWVMRDGRAFAIGNGTNGKICGKFPQSLLQKQTEISIMDSNGKQCIFLSAVCGTWYTLYLLQTSEGPDHLKLAYSCYNKEANTPIFINTKNLNPVALFGGSLTSAAVDQEGSVILITESIFKSPNLLPIVVNLPDDERAVSVGCLEQSFFILSESGIVYKCTLSENNESEPELKKVEELSEMKIVQISATAAHCLAVASNGRVFGHGLNENGRIGVSSPFSKIFNFQQITELKNKKIKCAFAGCNHSLFMTDSGAIYACGSNYNGELFMEGGPSEKDVLTPQLTMIKEKATFCIAGIFLSVAFVGIEPPPNLPNLRFDDEYPEFANPNLELNLPSDITSMDTSEVDRMILRPFSAFDELKQLEDDLISTSVSTFEPRTRTLPLNQGVTDINMVSASSQKKTKNDASEKNRPSSKGEQNPLSAIMNIGEKLINKEDSGKESTKRDQKDLSNASTPKQRNISDADKNKSEKQRNISDVDKNKSDEKLASSRSKLSAREEEKLASQQSKASKASKTSKTSKTKNPEETQISSIVEIGKNLVNAEPNSGAGTKHSTKSEASTKNNEKPLSSQHSKANDKSASNSAKPDQQSQNGQPSILNELEKKARNILQSDGKENSGDVTKRELSNAPSEKAQMSSASNMDEKPTEKSGKGEIASNSMTHSISSEKIKTDSKNEEKRSSRNASSAAKSDNKSQKGMESSAKSKVSSKSKEAANPSDAQKRSISSGKNSQSGKGEQNPISALLKAAQNIGDKENSGNDSKNDEVPLSIASSNADKESEKQRNISDVDKNKSDEKLASSQSKTMKSAEGSKLSAREEEKLASQHSKASKASKTSKTSKTKNPEETQISSIVEIGKNLVNAEPNSGAGTKHSTKSEASTKNNEKPLSSQHSNVGERSINDNNKENNSEVASKHSTKSEKSKASTKGDEKPLSSQHSNVGERSINNNNKENNSEVASKHSTKSEKSKASTKGDEKPLSSQHSNAGENSATNSKHSLPSDKSKATTKSQEKSQQSTPQKTEEKNLSKASKSSPTKRTESPKTKTKERNLSKDSTKSPKATVLSDEKPFYFESNNDANPSSGSRLSMNSELAHLRQQNNEMKELLASKDKEIARLTRLNETFVDNNKDLQSHLGECWDNQQHKIDKLDNMNSKRRKK